VNEIGWSTLRCICVSNALMCNPLCPYHGDTDLIAGWDPQKLAEERQLQWSLIGHGWKKQFPNHWPNIGPEFVQVYCESDCVVSQQLHEQMLPPEPEGHSLSEWIWPPPGTNGRRVMTFIGGIIGFLLVGLVAAALMARSLFQ